MSRIADMVNSSTFTHKDRTYVVSAMTTFQASLSFLTMVDLCKDATGIEWDDAPLTPRKFIRYFIEWGLCTTIDGIAFNLLTDANADKFAEFSNLVASDSTLADKWLSAYEEANLEQTDPNVLNAEPEAGNE